MGDAVLEDFRGKDCAFVAYWLRGKGLNKLCGVFEGGGGFQKSVVSENRTPLK